MIFVARQIHQHATERRNAFKHSHQQRSGTTTNIDDAFKAVNRQASGDTCSEASGMFGAHHVKGSRDHRIRIKIRVYRVAKQLGIRRLSGPDDVGKLGDRAVEPSDVPACVKSPPQT
jgi:hypothetical protein